jgi:aspartate aminotransferase/aminotransferase
MKINKPNMQISQKVSSIPEALSIYVNNVVYAMKSRGERVVTLSLGEAYFDIPMFDFNKIDFKRGCHYSESRGLPELRTKIANYYNKHYGSKIDAESEVIISAGSKPLIYMAMQAVLNKGDEVLVHEPAWLSYPAEAKLADAIPKFIPYFCEVNDFNQYFTDKTKMLILNNPNNPAGRVYTETELKYIYRECRSRGIYLMLDEAYSDFLSKGSFTSISKVVPDLDGVIIVNSLSKNLGISGWRIGYAISTPKVIFNILKLNQHLITCAPTVLLLYLVEYFDQMLAITVPQARIITEKRNRIGAYMKKIGLQPLNGSATFYFFVSIENYSRSSRELGIYLLLKYRIAVVPGSAYGKSTDKFIRIGVGVETDETLFDALDTINRVIVTNEYDEIYVERMLKELNLDMFEDCN